MKTLNLPQEAKDHENFLRIKKGLEEARSGRTVDWKKVKAKYNLELMAGSTLNVYKEALSSFRLLRRAGLSFPACPVR